jgi:triosephosphate isomerase
MARTPIIGGNWKANPKTLAEAATLAQDLRHRLGSQRGAQVVVFPPSCFLETVAQRIDGSLVALGGQDLWLEPSGAFTGAVTGPMLASLGCGWVLVGHSERRTVFGESNAVVARKLAAALAAGLKPVLCIGENLAEREGGTTFAVIDAQLEILREFDTGKLAHLVLAYEPVWAIGTGRVATPEQAQEVHAHIRGRVAGLLGRDFAHQLRIQYGGSVKAATAAGLMAQPDIDGLLVGGASLQIDEFTGIVRPKAN